MPLCLRFGDDDLRDLIPGHGTSSTYAWWPLSLIEPTDTEDGRSDWLDTMPPRRGPR